jgi:glycosyltransferase involved in cell wall biosynthesis
MKILAINHYSGSDQLGMEYRHFYLAQALMAAGHEVFIVASRFSHLRTSQPERQALEWSEHGGIPHLWLAGCSYRGNGVGRVANMIGFGLSLRRHALRVARQVKPDVVLASSPHPFAAYGAMEVARRAQARFIFEIRDLWPLSLIELGGIPARHPLMRALNHAEAFGCRHADKVVSVLPCVHDYMTERGVGKDKWISVPNGVLESEWHEPWQVLPDPLRILLSGLKEKGLFIVGYAGTHGIANALETLVDAAALMAGEKIAFVLVGDGAQKDDLKRRARDRGLQNICFLDPVGKHHVPALLQWFDAAYIGWHRHSLYRFGIAPNKLMDYMMAARPVLHAVVAGNDAVGEAGCGITVMPGDAEAIAQGVRALAGLGWEEREAMGRRGHKFVLKHHTYEVLAQRFLAACA